MLEGAEADIAPDITERVHQAAIRRAPPDELDGELEGGLRRADERILVDAERLIEHTDLGDRRLPHPDRADRLGLDEVLGKAGLEKVAEGGGGHPARRAAAGNDDADRFGSGLVAAGFSVAHRALRAGAYRRRANVTGRMAMRQAIRPHPGIRTCTVTYTHPLLPTNSRVYILVVAVTVSIHLPVVN